MRRQLLLTDDHEIFGNGSGDVRQHVVVPTGRMADIPNEKQRAMVSQLGMGRTPASVLRFLAQRFPIKLDFHNMSSGQLLRWIRNAPPAPEGDMEVIVLIGHSKEHRDDKEFERFLAAVAADPKLEVVSMSQIAERLRERMTACSGGL